ncbi:MAG: DUF3090 family protein [Acidimicrobiia bacterium]
MSFEFDAPDKVTVGTVGEPGQRTFFVQAREGRRVLTLKVEKEQVRQLSDYLATILDDVAGAEDIAAVAAASADLDLETPIEQDWIVGLIRVAPYDPEANRVHILFEEFVAEEEGVEPRQPASARVSLSPAQVGAFVRHSATLVMAGRETCLLCGNPKDPAGHACPRSNGHGG